MQIIEESIYSGAGCSPENESGSGLLLQPEQKTAIAIGKFDGLHRGHKALLEKLLARKQASDPGKDPGDREKTLVFTFHPSATVFFGGRDEKELTTRAEKRLLFERMGIDILVEFPLNAESAAMPAERFVREILSEKLHAGYIAAGADVSFGCKGQGDRKLLEQLAGELGYRLEIIDKISDDGREISSTYVREAVSCGDMETAERLLGNPYFLAGEVESGNRLGRRLGFPTLNLYPEPDKLLPPNGVYFSRVLVEGCRYPGITNIGRKPTVNQTDRISVETFLYDFDKDLYGRKIVTELLHFQRPEFKFADVAALKRQMEQDISNGRSYHGN